MSLSQSQSQSQSQSFSISKPLVSSCFLISSQFLMMLMNARNNTSRSVFTASQWQELDNQAQIFKHMVSGIPIPPDLTFYIKRNCLDISSRLFSPPHHQPLGWGCYEMGFGRKPDPEPGRCRRTDGKKWRCSKEAFLDSKYCERHMHRGRNRSRKPVEIATTKQPISISSLMAATENETHHHHNTTTTLHPFLYTQTSSSTPSSGIDFSLQNSNTHLVLDSGFYSQSHKDYRHFQGLKEEESNKCNDFFMRSFSPDPKKLRQSCSDFQSGGGYSQFQLQSLTDISKDQQKQHHKEQQHCFVLGTDFKSKTNPVMKMEKREEEPKQPLRHFFDEWPLKSRDSSSSSSSWLDLEENRSSNQAYFSNTQLSISIPMSSSNDYNSRNS